MGGGEGRGGGSTTTTSSAGARERVVRVVLLNRDTEVVTVEVSAGWEGPKCLFKKGRSVRNSNSSMSLHMCYIEIWFLIDMELVVKSNIDINRMFIGFNVSLQ